jgi:hypothetical protein
MTSMPECKSIAEVLTCMAHGGPEWLDRIVTIHFNSRADAWVVVYPIEGNDSPYFDFAYSNEARPQDALAKVLERHSRCSVIDWSPGRLACIQAEGASVIQLTELIGEVAKEVFGIDRFIVEASYAEMHGA